MVQNKQNRTNQYQPRVLETRDTVSTHNSNLLDIIVLPVDKVDLLQQLTLVIFEFSNHGLWVKEDGLDDENVCLNHENHMEYSVATCFTQHLVYDSHVSWLTS